MRRSEHSEFRDVRGADEEGPEDEGQGRSARGFHRGSLRGQRPGNYVFKFKQNQVSFAKDLLSSKQS